MLKRLIELKKAYVATTFHSRDLLKYHMPEDDSGWNNVIELIKLLEPFEEATKLISQGHSPTLSDVAVVYHYLFEKLEKYTKSKDEKLQSTREKTRRESEVPAWLRNSAAEGWKKLQKYYSHCDELAYVVATVLDPRYKMNWFKEAWEKEYVDTVRRKVTNVWRTKYKTRPTSNLQDSISPVGFNIASIVSEKLKKFHGTEDELQRYLKSPVVDGLTLPTGIAGALQWWKVHAEGEYPLLSKMARDYLAISASGVPVERLFSTGTDVISHRRYSLNANSIRDTMCLKQWIKLKTSIDTKKFQIDSMDELVKEKAGYEDTSIQTQDEESDQN